MPAGDMCRIGLRPDNNEVIPGNLPPLAAVAFGDKAIFGLGVMHQYKIGVAARRGRERLPGPLGDDPHVDPRLLGEQRQDFRE